MSKPKETDFEKSVALYNKAVSMLSNIEVKGKTTPYTSVNGHMFSFISKEGVMGLRLSEEDRELFIKKHKTGLMTQHGVILKEYAEVPFAVLKNSKLCAGYLQQSFDYVSSLKPKPTKRK
jgi:hypothetical protein